MDLFTPIVPKEKQHHNFAKISSAENGFDCDVLTNWAAGFPDRDGKFIIEFQTSFNSSFWELYLHAVLKQYSFKINWDFPSPDFYIESPQKIIIEATIASNEQDSCPEFKRSEAKLPNDLNEFNRKTIIRLSNSIHSKYQKYLESYSSLQHVKGRPFIIAVSAYDRPFFSLTCQRAIEALLFEYYVDEEEYLSKSDRSEPLIGKHLGQAYKDSGASIKLGLFSRPIMPEVSAIIFSSTATFGKVRALSSDPTQNIVFDIVKYNMHSVEPHKFQIPKHRYTESILDGLRIYHNPYANFPIAPSLFRNKDVFQSYGMQP
jgi:hypothetical protein